MRGSTQIESATSAPPALPVRVALQPGGKASFASLVLTAVVSLAADFNTSHLFNPDWPPHAVFHGAAMLNLLTGMCLLGLWLICRRTAEPDIAAGVAFAIPVVFWTPFFWLTSAMPNASLNAFDAPPPLVGGFVVYPNLIAATVFVLLSGWGFAAYRRNARHR
jgi:hypothetical protein